MPKTGKVYDEVLLDGYIPIVFKVNINNNILPLWIVDKVFIELDYFIVAD